MKNLKSFEKYFLDNKDEIFGGRNRIKIKKVDIDNTFVRYGRMHLTKQKGFGEDSFHAPPAPIGFYAFPMNY
jgi:hypothetical protein